MKVIELTRGKFSTVDDEDYEYLSKFSWYMDENGYAVRTVNFYKENGKRSCRVIFMHREIMGVNDPDIKVDHKKHNTLNNCKDNLRICSHNENLKNMSAKRNSPTSSKYKGVCWDKRQSKWQAKIGYNMGRIHIGRFNTEEEAALAYNEKAKELFGEFACLNDVEEEIA